MERKKYLFKIGVLFVLLGCSTIVALSQDSINAHYSPRNLSFKEEMRRLDIAAAELKLAPNKIVWLLGYNKVGRKKSTAMQRLKRSKQYLIRKHGISPERINTGYAGRDEEGILMRIYIVPKDAPSPFAK